MAHFKYMINSRLRNYFLAEDYSEAALGFHMYGNSIDDRTNIQFPQPHLRFESILFVYCSSELKQEAIIIYQIWEQWNFI